MLPHAAKRVRVFVHLLLLLWSLATTGCGPQPSEIVSLGEVYGLRKVYENMVRFERPPEQVFGALLQVLDEDSAVITARDERSGFLAWCDRSGAFCPLGSINTGRAEPFFQQDLSSPRVERFHGVVFAAARLKAHGNGTVLALHASRRDENPAVLEYSNGNYERHIYRRLQNCFAREELKR